VKGGRKNWDEHKTTTTNDTPQEGRNNRRTLLMNGRKLGCRPVIMFALGVFFLADRLLDPSSRPTKPIFWVSIAFVAMMSLGFPLYFWYEYLATRGPPFGF